MANRFNSILSNHLIPEKGITTYLQYKLHMIWPNLYGSSLLTLGEASSIAPMNMWYPSSHIHGLLCNSKESYKKLFLSHTHMNCYLSIDRFPFQNCSFDYILYLHDPNITKEQFTILLRSFWQILNDSGKVILLLPNQLGWWSVIDNLSLRYRNVFQMKKLNRLLVQNMFHITHYERLLYFPPPLMNILSLRVNKILEFLGVFFLPFLGGYHLIEIKKDLYAPITISPAQNHYILQQQFSKTTINCKDSS